MPTTDIDYYKPAIEQELQTNKGDKAFDYVYDMLYNLPTGEDLKKDMLFVFAGENSDSSYNAWKCQVTLVVKNLNTVEEKIYFTVNINKITRGTATVSPSGEPTFTAAS